MIRKKHVLAASLAAMGIVSAASTGEAAGIYFSDRGVRPMARAGAFVAGADDLGAIHYNPAGLVDAQSQLLVDASWLAFSAEFQRKARVTTVDPNTGEPGTSFRQTFPKVEGTTPVLPLPTLAGSYAITKDLVVGGGVYAPYSALISYPEQLAGQPAPNRYSLITLEGSALSTYGIFIAGRPLPWLQIGGGPTVILGQFQSEVMFGACVPDRLVCASEQPDYDAKGRITSNTIVAPGANIGATIIPHEMVRVGLSYQLGATIDTDATLQTQLPAASVFQNAQIQGDQANVHFRLPPIARIGVEVRPLKTTRVELAFVHEGWSVHDRIQVTPRGNQLVGVKVFPDPYQLGNITIERNFKDAWSLRLGGEHQVMVGKYAVDLRAGLSYEKSAVPPSHLSVLTVDMDKTVVGTGVGIHVGKNWRFDGTLAFIISDDVEVDVDEAAMYKVNPVRANRRPSDDIPINAGTYSTSAVLLGAGVRYQFR